MTEKLKIELPGRSYLILDLNPSGIRQNFRNVYDQKVGVGDYGGELEYRNSEVDELTMTILLDGTGVNDFGAVHAVNSLLGLNSVKDQLETFLNKVARPYGDTHEPPEVRLLWGGLNFLCKLVSVDINYKLFDNSGNPLRVELNTTFQRFMTDEEWQKIFNKKSPDVTHERILKAGETLPMLCQQIYGNSRLYLQVARANRIRNFRDIKPGSQIVFPPLV